MLNRDILKWSYILVTRFCSLKLYVKLGFVKSWLYCIEGRLLKGILSCFLFCENIKLKLWKCKLFLNKKWFMHTKEEKIVTNMSEDLLTTCSLIFLFLPIGLTPKSPKWIKVTLLQLAKKRSNFANSNFFKNPPDFLRQFPFSLNKSTETKREWADEAKSKVKKMPAFRDPNTNYAAKQSASF